MCVAINVPPSQYLIVPSRTVTVVKIRLDPIHILLETLFESLSQSRRNISQVKMALTKTSRHWCHLPALIVARRRRRETGETEVLVEVKLLPPPLSQHGLHLRLPSCKSFCQEALRGGGKKGTSRIFQVFGCWSHLDFRGHCSTWYTLLATTSQF